MADRIIGLTKLQQKLKRLPLVVKEQIRKAMADAADEIVSLAKSLAPDDTGSLKDSIAWIWGDAPKGLFPLAVVAGVGGASDLKITVVAGDDEAFYARWIEFGTAPHNVAKGGGTVRGKKQLAAGGGTGHPGAVARPFFYVSYRAMRKRARGKITRAINKAAKQVAASGS